MLTRSLVSRPPSCPADVPLRFAMPGLIRCRAHPITEFVRTLRAWRSRLFVSVSVGIVEQRLELGDSPPRLEESKRLDVHTTVGAGIPPPRLAGDCGLRLGCSPRAVHATARSANFLQSQLCLAALRRCTAVMLLVFPSAPFVSDLFPPFFLTRKSPLLKCSFSAIFQFLRIQKNQVEKYHFGN